MILYLSIIFISVLIIAATNCAIFDITFLVALLYTLLFTLEEIVLNAICAFTISKMIRNKSFNEDSPLFNISKRELNFYKKIKVKNWKNIIPDLGGLGGFKKNKIEKPDDIEYLKKYYYEINNGILVHFVSLFVGFLIVLCPPYWFFGLSIPVGVVSFVLNLLPIFVLKYNKHKLKQIIAYKSNRKSEEITNG